jgi:acyl-CoA synthetase (AMP-forming)/AMP-acid ligase II
LPAEEWLSPADGFFNFEELIKCPPSLPEHGLDTSALAQIVYTSGTESRPNGVMLTHTLRFFGSTAEASKLVKNLFDFAACGSVKLLCVLVVCESSCMT